MSLLTDIQAAAAAQITAQPFFAGDDDTPAIHVLAEDKGDIQSMVRDAIERTGAFVLVSIGRAPVTYPDIPGPRYNSLELIVSCVESPALNRTAAGTHRTALQIAQAAEAALHLVTLPVEGVSVLRSSGIYPDDSTPGILCYSVRLTLDAGGGEPADRVIPQVTWPDDPPPDNEPDYQYGRLSNGRLEVRNLTTGLWHPIYVTGPAGGERIALGQGVPE